MPPAQEQTVSLQYLAATEDFPFLAGREAKIQFVELHANADRSSILTMCRLMEGYPADKDLAGVEVLLSRVNGPALRIR